METQWTPGPWCCDGRAINGRDNNGYWYPLAIISCLWNDPEVEHANARLIAAAPAMAEALGRVYEELYQLHGSAHGHGTRECPDRGPTGCPTWEAIYQARAILNEININGEEEKKV